VAAASLTKGRMSHFRATAGSQRSFVMVARIDGARAQTEAKPRKSAGVCKIKPIGICERRVCTMRDTVTNLWPPAVASRDQPITKIAQSSRVKQIGDTGSEREPYRSSRRAPILGLISIHICLTGEHAGASAEPRPRSVLAFPNDGDPAQQDNYGERRCSQHGQAYALHYLDQTDLINTIEMPLGRCFSESETIHDKSSARRIRPP
jgi:hypothetical protein